MKLLIIGDNPDFFGGVTNYTRPLAEKLSKHIQVCYLFNSTRTESNSFFRKRGIYALNSSSYQFDSYQLVNGKADYKNYNNLNLDYSDWFDNIFIDFLNDIKPTVVHVNEFFGFSTSIFKIIKQRGIRLVVTVHEYWWLCPHRVMVDHDRKICSGPANMDKCTFCVSQVKGNYPSSVTIALKKLNNDFPWLMNTTRGLLRRNSKSNEALEELSFGNANIENFRNEKLKSELVLRLNNLTEALNNCDLIIAVSNDVLKHLKTFGINEELIKVQHIGSLVAEKNIVHSKGIDKDNIIFGFIGGVGYYKGVHQMVEAYTRLPLDLKERASLHIYGKYSNGYRDAILQEFINSEIDRSRIFFFGGFSPEDIPRITNEIDINVLPSLCADTAPQTIFESFSNGLPIIAPSVGGFPDFVVHGMNGLLYEHSSVKGIFDCFEKIINYPELIEIFQSNIPQCKTISENVEELIELYKAR